MAGAGVAGAAREEDSLRSLFAEGMRLSERVDADSEPTNSSAVQMSIKQAMHKFEKATQLVSLSGMFSRNESIEEVTTDSLQYLLLPALLGTLSLKLCNQPRKEIIDVAEIYFRDFLQRCKDYGVTDVDIPPHSTGEVDSPASNRNQTEVQKITGMVLSREAKIKRYKEQKELKEKLMTLKKTMESELVDDQTKREYFTTLILDYVNQSLDELASIEQEKPILEYMAKHAGENKPYAPENKMRTPSHSLKPIIITKDAVQKAVYGLGYPSIPTMTIEEFYDKRVREGTFPGACSTNIPHATIQSTDDDNGEDGENIRKERLIEEEDPEELARQRSMDEFKDDHRRGWGNRHNRS